MPFANTPSRYGSVTKSFHWVIALSVIAMIPLGLIANAVPFDSAEALARKVTLFSVHKTLGVLIFFTALARIAWAISQPKPGPLNSDARAEVYLASIVHWILYASLVVVPLSGWISHAATQGFAPIWLPIGQDLPLIQDSARLSERAGNVHIICERVLTVAILLHIAGALKHHLIDGDATLRRMLPGATNLPHTVAHKFKIGPPFLAASVCGVAIAIGAIWPIKGTEDRHTAALAPVQSDWVVESGSISISVVELKNQTTGSFSDWTAEIDYSPTPNNGVHGSVDVNIALTSLSLGAVTDVALGREFFGVNEHPTARFFGPIVSDIDGHYVDGALMIREKQIPVKLPFTLVISGDRAEMQGAVTVNRLEFDVGPTYDDPSQVAFEVEINITVIATKP